jgi:hypothetical protein
LGQKTEEKKSMKKKERRRRKKKRSKIFSKIPKEILKGFRKNIYRLA